MLQVYAIPDKADRKNLWGSKVEVRTDKDGKNPYLFARPHFEVQDGRKISFGYYMNSDPHDFLYFDRYFYTPKDLNSFKSAVRLRHMPLDEFVYQYGFKVAGYDPQTLQEWYVCVQEGRLPQN